MSSRLGGQLSIRRAKLPLTLYTVSLEERPVFWKVTVLVIINKECICTCVAFRMVS
jgi:hypothetical protein